MVEKQEASNGGSTEPKKLLEQNIVWFAIGLIVAGAVAAVTFLSFLDQRIDDRIANTPDLVTRIAATLAQEHSDDLRGPPPTTEVIDAAIQRVVDDTADIGAGDIPIGAVVAFDLPNECPKDWKRFWHAGGRFIIGAGRHSPDGNDERNVDQNGEELSVYPSAYDGSSPGNYTTGGLEKLTLTTPQIPSHSHELDIDQVQSSGVGRASNEPGAPIMWGVPNETTIRNTHGVVGHQGEALPHDNMPPYVALYFCKYEGAG